MRPLAAEGLAAARVLVVGDAMLDRYWFGAVERISPEAPVPVVQIQREEERLGGAANVALNVQRLGARATLLTVVGDDEPARSLQRLLDAQGVASVLGRDAGFRTIVKLRVVGRSQQLIRLDFESPPDHELLAQLTADYERLLPSHDAVLFSDYGKGGLTHIAQMIDRARAAGKPVLVDPKGRDFSRYAGATVVTPTAPNWPRRWAPGRARTTCSAAPSRCAPSAGSTACWSRDRKRACRCSMPPARCTCRHRPSRCSTSPVPATR